jgi:glycosyltransferase involved in cell wall biosynthesis
LRVGINATCFNNRPSGARQRFIGIYGALFRLLPNVEFLLYEPADCCISTYFPDQLNLQACKTPIPSVGRISKYLIGLSYWHEAFNRDNLDLFEAMHLPLIRPDRATTLLTLHDIRGIYPDNGLLQRQLFASVLRKSLERADRVVTVSSTMRNEILAFYPEASVSVIYNGIDVSLFDSISLSACRLVASRYRLPRNFLLSVGHFERRKNYSLLVQALVILNNRGLTAPLVIVGNDSGSMIALQALVDALGLSNQVQLLTGLSDYDVRCIYLLSSLFVFPSIYEGFGIPILEAMAAQRPMVLSNLPVFHEITQGQAIYFNPYSAESMADAISNVLYSSITKSHMTNYFKQRVHDFSFEKMAFQLSVLYSGLS